jgi:hypothetical protein
MQRLLTEGHPLLDMLCVGIEEAGTGREGEREEGRRDKARVLKRVNYRTYLLLSLLTVRSSRPDLMTSFLFYLHQREGETALP